MGVASLNGVQVNGIILGHFTRFASQMKPYIESLGVQYPVCSHTCAVFYIFLSFSAVHGSSEAASDACETSAGPDLPATRSPQEGPPLHLHPDPLLGSAVDPQVHRGCHHIPCHGETRVRRKKTF